VIFRASAARSRCVASFQRIAAHPSGEITEYTEFSSISTPVRQAHRECPARPPLADHRGDDGRPERGHLDQAARDGFGLAALLRPEAGVGRGYPPA